MSPEMPPPTAMVPAVNTAGVFIGQLNDEERAISDAGIRASQDSHRKDASWNRRAGGAIRRKAAAAQHAAQLLSTCVSYAQQNHLSLLLPYNAHNGMKFVIMRRLFQSRRKHRAASR